MGVTEWVLVGIASWFLIGYLNSRIINDSPIGHDWGCNLGVRKCYHVKHFHWSRPIETVLGRNMFGLGVVLGPAGVVGTAFVLLAYSLGIFFEKVVIPIGQYLAPK